MSTATLQLNIVQIPIIAVTSNSSVLPFTATRTLDNFNTPTSRWLGNSIPGVLTYTLPNLYYINSFSFSQMSALGWNASYNITSLTFSVSLDGSNWTFVPINVNLANSKITAQFPYVKARFVRLSTGPLSINPNLTSIANFSVFGAFPTNNQLSNLTCSVGVLNPSFNPNTNTYTVNVSSSVLKANLTPTSYDSNAQILVNNVQTTSGQASSDINLNYGNNIVSVIVKPQVGDTFTYNVNIIRATESKLINLTCSSGALIPSFNSSVNSYVVNVDNNITTTTITPTAEISNSSITVNGVNCVSGQSSQAIPLNVGDNNISVVITAPGSTPVTYTINVKRAAPAPAPTLSNLVVAGYTGAKLTPNFSPNIYNYTSPDAKSYHGSASITATVSDPSSTLKINGNSATSGVATIIALVTGVNTIQVSVTLNSVVTNYTVVIKKG